MSDSITDTSQGIVVGTAGHIDHGKSSLVRALTGIDTDRLAEEKRRGISIDLGFAHLALASGRSVSFVDVPGHERFIRNMLAGAAGMEAVLLIIAADESVKPQTREHFEICRLLGIKRGIIALTKTDLATPEQLAATRAATAILTSKSFLSGAPVIPVSAVTGEGLPELRAALEQLAQNKEPRSSDALPRLPIDRSFALKGFGTVVTGTLSHGSLRVGARVTLLPVNTEARIRGLQVHGKPVTLAQAGQRTAVNLSGVNHSDIQRGYVLAFPHSVQATQIIQASVNWLAEAEIPQRREDFLLHIGTSEANAHVKVLSSNIEERRSLVQLNVSDPVIALPGDRFVLRRPSPSETVGGGVVIDAFPPKRLNRVKAVERIERLSKADLPRRLELLVEEKDKGRSFDELVHLTGETSQQIHSALMRTTKALVIDAAQRVVSPAWLNRRREIMTNWLKEFHTKHPGAAGAPLAHARLGLESPLANFVLTDFPAIRIEGDLVALATHKPRVTNQQAVTLQRIEQEFRKAAYQPQAPAEVLRTSGASLKDARSLLENLIKAGKLVRVSDELVFHAEIIAHIRTSLAAHKGRRFSVPEFKQWTQVSRKYAIPLLEYLDHQRVTRREGDNRIVL